MTVENVMSPDSYFALTLIVKMAITAGFVLAATATAERAGPLVGGLVATLPISAGPVYVFLALDHDAPFIAASAILSLVGNANNVIFALVYALLAQKRSLVASLSATFAVWLSLTWFSHSIQWTLGLAAGFNVIVIGVGLWLARPLRLVSVPGVKARWFDLALRAAAVALLVGVVVVFSFRLGPGGSGTLAVFPIVLSSVIVILHRRVGGPVAAAVMANAILGLVGFAVAAMVLHLTAESLGVPLSLALALAISAGTNALFYAARQRGIPV
jgi:hypothetical protein